MNETHVSLPDLDIDIKPEQLRALLEVLQRGMPDYIQMIGEPEPDGLRVEINDVTRLGEERVIHIRFANG